MQLPGPQVSLWVPVTPPIAAVLPSASLCPCATFRSPHTAGVVQFFDIGCWQNTGLP
ncbi:unnamed protein product [Staurois parvus]|uniref:Secreted protein n=1 Tax=Staurois parvus TaxID=386267 RepID=A0ABN9BJP2_9NEOB|nr:unnamed protein product [Staurois parvus]